MRNPTSLSAAALLFLGAQDGRIKASDLDSLKEEFARLNTKSGQYTEYMLPRPTNIRRVYVDDSKNPGTLWIGSNHGASIVKLEPLE